MSIIQLDTENNDYNLTTSQAVLTHTPDALLNMICQGYIVLGDGIKNLDGSGGNFQFIIAVGGQTVQPSPQTMTFSTAVRSAVWTTLFPVPANAVVTLAVLSPNGADTDVDVTAYLFDVSAQGVLVNNNLDHWMKIATGGADMTAEVADNTVLSRILANGDTSAFDPSTDGLQPIRDLIAALNDLSSADVATACLAALNIYDPPTAAEVATAIRFIVAFQSLLATEDDAYVDDEGREIMIEVGTDLALAAVTRFDVKKPGEDVTWTPTVYNSTFLRYVTVTDDLNEVGKYYIQVYIELGTFKGHIKTAVLNVKPLWK